MGQGRGNVNKIQGSLGTISPKCRMALGGGIAEVSMMRLGAHEALGSKRGAWRPLPGWRLPHKEFAFPRPGRVGPSALG